ncbi:MAG: tryptophan-rich sensory protein [Austwickia sp.]|jgi:hypothetical protein|nr:tryptophan-rich sensory protein [Austwickia sp.]MBK8437824.1 tryptophan-rich sensory protein [Austwickia sp.]MBK9100131.1 tryptophan-rich sensory protein [Austwickia sp.]
MTHPSSTLTRDRVLVTVAGVLCLVGTALGTGLLGDSVATQGEGLFSDSATLIAPHGPAFSIWSVIYLGLFGYVGWQWLPASAGSSWAALSRRLGAASLALNGLWLLVVQAGWVWVSVVVIVGLLATLAVLYRRFTGTPDSGVAEKALVQGTFGLYLGWVCVAVCANIAVALVDSGVPPTGTGPAWATVAVLAAVVGIAAGVVWTPVPLVARCAAGAAVVWGLSWVAAGRLADAPSSALVGWSAAAAAAMVAIAVAVSARMVSTRSAA